MDPPTNFLSELKIKLEETDYFFGESNSNSYVNNGALINESSIKNDYQYENEYEQENYDLDHDQAEPVYEELYNSALIENLDSNEKIKDDMNRFFNSKRDKINKKNLINYCGISDPGE